MYEYQKSKRSRRPRSARESQQTLVQRPTPAECESASIVTMLEPAMRSRLDAATQDTFRIVHAESITDALSAVRNRSVRALLLSPRMLGEEPFPGIGQLVMKSPGVMTVAVVSDHEPATGKGLLDLGACGVRRFVDLTGRDGWSELRSLVTDTGGETAVAILDTVMPAFGEATEGSREFFCALVRLAPSIRTVSGLSRSFRIHASTLLSRFFRAGLPSPRRYLSETRLVYAAALLEVGGASIADVANRLDYSSPQSFGRTVRTVTGVPASQFRRSPFANVLEEYMKELIVPYQATFRSFDPLGTERMVRHLM